MHGMVSSLADAALARDALRSCPLFAGLDDSTLMLCADAMRGRKFRRGEVVFHVEDPGDALFVVSSGEIKIVLPSEEGAEPVILTTLGRGGFFGELALLDGRPRSASAIAVRAAEVLVLRRDAFDRLVDAEPELRRAMFASLTGEIRRLTGQIADLHFLDLPGRLARHLLRMGGVDEDELDGRPRSGVTSEPIRLAWPYTQSELAGMIGGSRQSVNRMLSDFVQEDLLRFEGNELVIPDPGRLARAVSR
jgi:CRP/FNR family transcriptional regulator/CRP/FNR family cyclic AMP-dependent transcriptional regulator